MATPTPLAIRSVRECPACGGDAVDVAYRPDEAARERFRFLSRKRYAGRMDGWETRLSLIVLRCRLCGHLWHADQPDAASLKGMYDARAELRGDRARAPDAGREEAARRQMRRLRRLIGGGGQPSLLDYGAGAGVWTRAARAAGFDAVGFEPSSARSNSAAPAVDALDDLPQRVWDAINLEQVLEHIPDPESALGALRRRCKPGTVLRISVPDVGRAVRRADFWQGFPFGGQAHLLSPYEHLHGFTGQSLRRLLQRTGFREIKLGRIATAFLAYANRRIAAMVNASYLPTFFIGTPDDDRGS